MSFLAVTLAVLVPAPLQAQTVTDLVSNTGLGTLGNQESRLAATSFTTGSHEAGYDLSEIQISVHSVPSTVPAGVVTLKENNSGLPGDLVATLTNPSSFEVGDELNSFAAPSGTHLNRETTYWVVVNEAFADDDTKISWTRVSNSGQTGATGWSIGDFARFRTSQGGSWQSTSFKQQIVVRGSETTSDMTPGDASTDATLYRIGTTSGSLSPAFSPSTYTYFLGIDQFLGVDRLSVNVSATKNHNSQSVRINGGSDTEHTFQGREVVSRRVDVPRGGTTVRIVVTAEDGTTTRTYRLTVLRGGLCRPTMRACSPGRC